MTSSSRAHLSVVPDIPDPLTALTNRVVVPGQFSLDPWVVKVAEPLIDGWASGRVPRPAILSLVLSTAVDCHVNGEADLAGKYLTLAAHLCAVCDVDQFTPEGGQ